MQQAMKKPKGFQLGKCPKLYEETKGAAVFRMYPSVDKKSVHVEVWTPNMGRRKEKCLTLGTELSTVIYYYQLFIDYCPQNSTKTQLIYLCSTNLVKEGVYNEKTGCSEFDFSDRLDLYLRKAFDDNRHCFFNLSRTNEFPLGGIMGPTVYDPNVLSAEFVFTRKADKEMLEAIEKINQSIHAKRAREIEKGIKQSFFFQGIDHGLLDKKDHKTILVAGEPKFLSNLMPNYWQDLEDFRKKHLIPSDDTQDILKASAQITKPSVNPNAMSYLGMDDFLADREKEKIWNTHGIPEELVENKITIPLSQDSYTDLIDAILDKISTLAKNSEDLQQVKALKKVIESANALISEITSLSNKKDTSFFSGMQFFQPSK